MTIATTGVSGLTVMLGSTGDIPTPSRKPLSFASSLGKKFGSGLGKFMSKGSSTLRTIANSISGKSDSNLGSRSGPKLGPVEHNNEVVAILTKIYTYMKKTHEDDKLRFEEENNYKEEQKLEDERRHKELLAHLEALVGEQGEPTAKKESKEGSNFFSNIFSKLGDMWKEIGGLGGMFGIMRKTLGTLIRWTFSAIKKVGEVIANVAGKIGKYIAEVIEKSIRILSEWVAKAGRFLGRLLPELLPVGLAALPLLAMYGVTKWAESASIFGDNGEMTKTGKTLDTLQKAAGGRGLTPDSEKTAAKRLDEQTSFGMLEDMFGTKKKQQIKLWQDRIDRGTTVTPSEAAVLHKNLGLNVPKELIKQQEPSVREAAKMAAQTPPPVAPEGLGEQLNSVMATNSQLKLDEATMNSMIQPMETNVVDASPTVQHDNERPQLPPVRNQDDTYNDLLWLSSRGI